MRKAISFSFKQTPTLTRSNTTVKSKGEIDSEYDEIIKQTNELLRDQRQEKSLEKMLSQVQLKVKRRSKKKTSLMDQISILMPVTLIVIKKFHSNSQKRLLSISSTWNGRIVLKSIEYKTTSNLSKL